VSRQVLDVLIRSAIIEPNPRPQLAVMHIRRYEESDLREAFSRTEQTNTILHRNGASPTVCQWRGDWSDETAVDADAGRILRKHRRWFDMLAYEP
jgi:hypothetical protein